MYNGYHVIGQADTIMLNPAIKQMEMADEYPDIVIGCTGGGSNFGGIAFPFLGVAIILLNSF